MNLIRTIIIWKKLDRFHLQNKEDGAESLEDNFLKKFSDVNRYIEMIYHKFLKIKLRKLN